MSESGGVRKSTAPNAREDETEHKKKRDAQSASARPRVHAQRKFAQGQSNGSSPHKLACSSSSGRRASTNTAFFAKVAHRASHDRNHDANVANRPKTEDFLTFLCLRGTNLLPPELDHFNKVSQPSQEPSSDDVVEQCPSREVLDHKYGGTGVAKKTARPNKAMSAASSSQPTTAKASGSVTTAGLTVPSTSSVKILRRKESSLTESVKRPNSAVANSNGSNKTSSLNSSHSGSSPGMATRSSTTRNLRSHGKNNKNGMSSTSSTINDKSTRARLRAQLASRKKPSAAAVAAKRKTKLATMNLASRMLTRLTPRGTTNAAFVKRAKKMHMSNRSLRGREISISSDEEEQEENSRDKRRNRTRQNERQEENRGNLANKPRQLRLREASQARTAEGHKRRVLKRSSIVSKESLTTKDQMQRPSRRTKEAANVYLNMLGQKLTSKRDDDNISIASLNESTQERRLTELERGQSMKRASRVSEDDTIPIKKNCADSAIKKKGNKGSTSLKDLQNRLLAEAKEQITYIQDDEASSSSTTLEVKESDERITISQRTGYIQVKPKKNSVSTDDENIQANNKLSSSTPRDKGLQSVSSSATPMAAVGGQSRRLSKDGSIAGTSGPRKILPKTSSQPACTNETMATSSITGLLGEGPATSKTFNIGSSKGSIVSSTRQAPLPSASLTHQPLVISTALNAKHQPQPCSQHLQFSGAPLIMSAPPQMRSIPLQLNATKLEPVTPQFPPSQQMHGFINSGLQMANMQQLSATPFVTSSSGFVHQHSMPTYYPQNAAANCIAPYRFNPAVNAIRQDPIINPLLSQGAHPHAQPGLTEDKSRCNSMREQFCPPKLSSHHPRACTSSGERKSRDDVPPSPTDGGITGNTKTQTTKATQRGRGDHSAGTTNDNLYNFNEAEHTHNDSPGLLFRKRKSTASHEESSKTRTTSVEDQNNDSSIPLPKELANQLEARVKRERKSSNSEMTYFIPLHSNDGQSFGVSVKLNTEGPAGPNQKVIMKAKLVTNSDERPQGAKIIQETSSRLDFSKAKTSRLMPSTGDNEDESNNSGHSESASCQEIDSEFKPNSFTSNQDCCLGRIEHLEHFPKLGTAAHLVEAPIFAPTEDEFQDPLKFIQSIRSEAEAFGICKIIPPRGSFKPECNVQDDMRFTAYNQYVHKMMNRWGPNSKELAAIVKYLETQNIELKQHPLVAGIEVDLPALYHAVQSFGGLTDVIQKKRWNKIAEYLNIPKGPQDRGNKLYDIYCKYLLPYDTLSEVEREELLRLVEEEHEERHLNRLRKADDYGKQNEKMAKRDGAEGEESDQGDDDDDDEDDGMMECVVKGKSTSLGAFYRLGRNMMNMLFKSSESEPRVVEDQFWRLIRERDAHVQVQQGSIDTGDDNLGFPVSRDSSCGRHPWNLKMLSNNPQSLLRCMGPVMGVTVPTLNLGMVFTAGCWSRDPHGLPWIDYHHTGATKIWYAVPESHSIAFYTAIKQLAPTSCTNKKLWLPADSCMVPPSLLVKHGVSVSRVEQAAGEFIVVFSKSFTSSLCTGYLISESVYFAPTDYMAMVESEFEAIKESREPMMFPYGKLIVSVAQSESSTRETLQLVKPLIEKIRDNEYVKRTIISDLGVKNHERIILREKKDDQDDEYECEICSENLYISYLCDLKEDTYFCLDHGITYLQSKRATYRKHCKLYYTHSKEEISSIIKRLNNRLESDECSWEEHQPLAPSITRWHSSSHSSSIQHGKQKQNSSNSSKELSKGSKSSKSSQSSTTSSTTTSKDPQQGTSGISRGRGRRRTKTRKAAQDKSGGRLTVELLDMLLSDSESDESGSSSEMEESDDSWD